MCNTMYLHLHFLITFTLQGFPYGTKPGEEESVSLPNAGYTKGNYKVCTEFI